MSLVITDISSVPEQGWQYPHPVSGFITSFNYTLLYPRIVEAYQSNHVTIPSDQTVIDWQCNNLWIPCYESETHTPLINNFALSLSKPKSISGCCGPAMAVPTPGESL